MADEKKTLRTGFEGLMDQVFHNPETAERLVECVCVESFEALVKLAHTDAALFYEQVIDELLRLSEQCPSALDEIRVYFSGGDFLSDDSVRALRVFGLIDKSGEFVPGFYDVWTDYEGGTDLRFRAQKQESEVSKDSALAGFANDNHEDVSGPA